MSDINITVKKLTPELWEDYLRFFDFHAFSDGHDFSGCYCMWYHWSESLEEERNRCSGEAYTCFKRNLAKQYIQEGLLQGYLAYDNDSDQVVGWCNANDRQNYTKLGKEERADLWEDYRMEEKVKAIVCFIVAPEWRGRGIAGKLLKAVCEDAEKNGYTYVEAYPAVGEFHVRNYHGPISMYEKIGFLRQDNSTGEVVVRKYL